MNELRTTFAGLIGYGHDISCATTDSVLVIQLPRSTTQLSAGYIESTKKALDSLLPPGKQYLLIGADVNIYELAGVDALNLKLKGLI